MTMWVEKDGDVKEISKEDFAHYSYMGYKKTSKKVTINPEPVKKGRKRSLTEEIKEEE